MRAEGEELGAKVNMGEVWAPIVKDAAVLRGPQTQGVSK
jgi:hypothetical protein